MAYKTSVFPENGYDTFVQLYDLPLSYEPLVEEYIILRSKNRTPQEDTRYDELTGILQNYIIDTEKWNKFCDALTGVQKFFLENTQGYIDGLKTETRDYVDLKKQEIDTTVLNAETSINTTKDNALISIENKKDNVIAYLDGTTAGALRNDIGDMTLSNVEGTSLIDKTNNLKTQVVSNTTGVNKIGDLTTLQTTEKGSLVGAVNEISARTAELVPKTDFNEHLADNVQHLMPLVQEIIVDNPVTSVAFTNLDGEGDGGYFLVCEFIQPGDICQYCLYVEDDNIDTNYLTIQSYSSTSNERSRVGIGSLNGISVSNIDVTLSNEGKFIASTINVRQTEDAKMLVTPFDVVKKSPISNITTLSIVSTIPNGIGTGSRFRLFRRKKA